MKEFEKKYQEFSEMDQLITRQIISTTNGLNGSDDKVKESINAYVEICELILQSAENLQSLQNSTKFMLGTKACLQAELFFLKGIFVQLEEKIG